MPSRRLEDRIRELSGKVADAQGGEFDRAVAELKSALRMHTLQLRQMAADQLLKTDSRPERRERS